MPPDIRKSTSLFEDRNSIGMKIDVENLWNILTGENRRATDKPAQCHCVHRERLATDRLGLGTVMEGHVYQNTKMSISSLTLHINHHHCREQGVNSVEGEQSVVTVSHKLCGQNVQHCSQRHTRDTYQQISLGETLINMNIKKKQTHRQCSTASKIGRTPLRHSVVSLTIKHFLPTEFFSPLSRIVFTAEQRPFISTVSIANLILPTSFSQPPSFIFLQ